ncbi:hypothetical protein [Nostoc sp. CHAB 5715]|uniref:hypothetical protein n=1 Tax=Nostoc sp. CHAB 5715 TaxID=2780400 RepID=UPI001E2BF7FC|nr:hypothetical protein [Nostoc sp. CHAB 5715]MCC5622212.1 hypothetical protein [Nostoc sp. CHAB 5715]
MQVFYSYFQVIELHHSLLPTPHSPSQLWSKYLKNAVRCIYKLADTVHRSNWITRIEAAWTHQSSSMLS